MRFYILSSSIKHFQIRIFLFQIFCSLQKYQSIGWNRDHHNFCLHWMSLTDDKEVIFSRLKDLNLSIGGSRIKPFCLWRKIANVWRSIVNDARGPSCKTVWHPLTRGHGPGTTLERAIPKASLWKCFNWRWKDHVGVNRTSRLVSSGLLIIQLYSPKYSCSKDINFLFGFANLINSNQLKNVCESACLQLIVNWQILC